MRTIALQSAAAAWPEPAGCCWMPSPAAAGGRAVAQEVIDKLAVLNALRTAVPLSELTDYNTGRNDAGRILTLFLR
jgi:hypothetical protein